MIGSRRLLAYLAIATTQLMVILDGTVVTVALPAIRSDLVLSSARLPWVVNAFFLAFAVVLLPGGRLGDRVGDRRVFVGGLAAFTLASLWCGLAGDPLAVIVARAVQGAGGGAATAVALGMIARLYPEPVLRGRAFAGLAFVGSAGASIGLVAGGLLVQALSWPWAFLVNVPIGLAALVVAVRTLDPVTGRRMAGGLVPRALFGDPRFALAGTILFTMVMAGMSFQYLSSLYLQDTLGYGPLATGAAFLAVSGAIAAASLGLSGRLARRWGPARTLAAAMLVFLVGMLLMVRLPDDGSYAVDVLGPFLVMGLGFGVAMPQVTELAMGAAPASYASAASGFVSTVQQAGGAVGLFVVVAVANATSRGLAYLSAAAALAAGALVATRLARRSDVTSVMSATRAGAERGCSRA